MTGFPRAETKRGVSVAALIFFALFALPAGADEPRPWVIRRVRVFDGVKDQGLKDVWVRAGKILAVAAPAEPPGDIIVIDGLGKTLIPGLIDAHTHTSLPAHLEQAALFGVTTQLDMFTAVPLASLRGEGDEARADLRSSGVLITAPGGHGTQFGVAVEGIERPEQAPAFVDARIKAGADYIKVVYEHGRTIGREIPCISFEVLEAVVAAAHARELKAVVHVGDAAEARDAIAAGADGLVHIWTGDLDATVLDALARRGGFVVATLTVYDPRSKGLYRDPALAPFLSREDRSWLRRSAMGESWRPKFDSMLANLRQLEARGVPALIGSDARNPGTLYGVSVHHEMELFVAEGRYEPREALAAATSAAAKAFGLKDRGRIAAGLRADLVLVDGDPLTRITDSRKIAQVWVEGRRVDRAAARRRLAAIAERERAAPTPEALGDGLAADFDDGAIKARFGAGFRVSTDAARGGASKASLSLAPGGPSGSGQALKVSGEVVSRPGMPFVWAGVNLLTAEGGRPANLSSKKRLRFALKGPCAGFQVMLFTQSGGMMPATVTVAAKAGWQQVSIDFERFRSDGSDVIALWFGAAAPGVFEFELDDIRFE